MNDTENEEFDSIDDVVLRFHVSRRTVRDWIAAGVLPAFRLGPRLVRIRREDVDGLLRRLPTTEGHS